MKKSITKKVLLVFVFGLCFVDFAAAMKRKRDDSDDQNLPVKKRRKLSKSQQAEHQEKIRKYYDPFVRAMRDEDFQTAKQLLKEEPTIATYKSKRGKMMIHDAAEMGRIKFFDLLVQHGSNPLARTSKGLTALHFAVFGGNRNLSTVKHLVNTYQFDVNDKENKKRFSPLTIARQQRAYKVGVFLIDKGAYVAQNAHAQFTSHLFKSHQTKLRHALYANHVDQVKNCLHQYEKQGGTIKSLLKNTRVLQIAAQNRSVAIVTLLLKLGTNPNITNKSTGTSLLMNVASQGNVAIAKLLIQHGAKVNHPDYKSQTALDYALAGNNADMVQALLQAGAYSFNIDKLDNDGRTPFLNAVIKNNDGIAQQLATYTSTNVIHYDAFKKTALAYALENNNPQTITTAAQAMAKAGYINFMLQQITPYIRSAAENGQAATLTALLDLLATYNQNNFQQQICTLLPLAVAGVHLDAVKVIVRKANLAKGHFLLKIASNLATKKAINAAMNEDHDTAAKYNDVLLFLNNPN